MFKTVLSIAVLALALAACSSEPTCDQVVDHVLKMAKEDMAKRFASLPEDQRKQIEEMAAKELTREKFLEQCKQKATKEQLACMQKAKDLTEIAKCDTSNAPAAPGTPEGAAPAAPEGAAPAAPEGAAPTDPAPTAGGAQDPVGEGNAAEGANQGTPAAGAEGAPAEGGEGE